MLGFNAIAESAICEDGSISQPDGLIAVSGPLGAALVIGAAVLGLSSAPSMLRSPAVVAYRTVEGQSEAPGVLASALVRGAGSTGWASLPAILGAPFASGSIPLLSYAAAAHLLGEPRGLGFHDFTAMLGDVVTRYVMDLMIEGDAVRVPISSWQATLQTGASCYVQCVIPACLDWSEAINAADEFVISRVADTPTAQIEYEMARSPIGQVSMARGPTNFTATLSGYAPAFAEDEDPPETYDRTLSDVRSVTTGTALMRVRCAIDWLLRPGHRAYYGAGASFVVRYINYYVPATGDAYMDVGE